MKASTKLQLVGASYLSIAGFFLALIGFYPEGTMPHAFVSTWFFIQAQLAILMYGLGCWNIGKFLAASSITIFIFALAGPFIPWPSIALLEAYEVILINAFTILITFRIR